MEEKPGQRQIAESAPGDENQTSRAVSGPRPAPPKETVIQEGRLAKYRIAAKLIDVIPLTLFELTTFFVFFNSEDAGQYDEPGSAERVIGLILGFAIIWMGFGIIDVIYFFCFEYFSQATLGKKVFGLKVIDYVKGRPGARQILGRSIITAVCIHSVLWIIELLVMLTNRDGLRIADQGAGTKVIRVRAITTKSAASVSG